VPVALVDGGAKVRLPHARPAQMLFPWATHLTAGCVVQEVE
jgi:hypothetical protein